MRRFGKVDSKIFAAELTGDVGLNQLDFVGVSVGGSDRGVGERCRNLALAKIAQNALAAMALVFLAHAGVGARKGGVIEITVLAELRHHGLDDGGVGLAAAQA